MPQIKSKKSVQWTSSCSLRVFEMNTKEQRVDAWYQDCDFKTFRKQARMTARLAQETGTSVLENDLGESCRGLEHLVSKKLASSRLKRRNDSWFVVGLLLVLDGEDQKESIESYSADSIAKLYGKIAAPSQADAHQKALKYAEENRPMDTIKVKPAHPIKSALLFSRKRESNKHSPFASKA